MKPNEMYLKDLIKDLTQRKLEMEGLYKEWMQDPEQFETKLNLRASHESLKKSISALKLVLKYL